MGILGNDLPPDLGVKDFFSSKKNSAHLSSRTWE